MASAQHGYTHKHPNFASTSRKKISFILYVESTKKPRRHRKLQQRCFVEVAQLHKILFQKQILILKPLFFQKYWKHIVYNTSDKYVETSLYLRPINKSHGKNNDIGPGFETDDCFNSTFMYRNHSS